MKRNRILALVLSLVIALSCITGCENADGVPVSHETDTAKYKLVWYDEFNGDALDLEKWCYDIGRGYSGWGNNELQYYTADPANIRVEDGELRITAIREEKHNAQFTSARIKTLDLFEFRYGYVEARLKMPADQGLWPAFWMLGASGATWPSNGEIDIMEHINDETIVYNTAHWNGIGGHASQGGSTANNPFSTFSIDVTQYHVYALEWTEEFLAWYIDGVKYGEMDISDPDKGYEEMHNKYYMLLNLAVGGKWPGVPSDATEFPATYSVDYVRVYQ